ncbi:MAG: adenylate/guanylate cyclase domain-containing protein [Bacteroidota bacterium]
MCFYKLKKSHIILKVFALLFACVLNSLDLSAQKSSTTNNKIDSISALINNHPKDDTIKVRFLILLSNSYTKVNATKGIELAERSIAICKKYNYTKLQCEALNSLGDNYYAKNDIPKAIETLNEGIQLSNLISHSFGLGINYLSLSDILLRKGEIVKAREYLDKAFLIFKQLNFKEYIARTYNKYGNLENSLSNYKEAVNQFKASLKLNEEIGNLSAMAVNLGNLGTIYSVLSDYTAALNTLWQAYYINVKLGNQESMAKNLNNLGLVYRSMSDYPKAIEHFQKALSLSEKLENKKDISSYLGNISLVYSNLEDFKMAMEYQQKAILIEESLDRKIEMARGYGNIGSIFINQKNYEAAMEYLQKALAINQSIGNKKGVAVNLKNIGEVNLILGQYTQALNFQKQSLAINEEIGNKPGQSNNLLEIGNIFRDSPDSFALNQGVNASLKYKKADSYYIKSLNIAQDINALNEQQRSWLEMSKNYDLAADYKEAYKAYKNYIEIRDSIINEGTQKKITQKEMQYNFDKKETELKYQQQLVDQKLQEQILYAKQKQQELELKEKKLALSQQNEQLQRLAYLKEKAEKQDKQKQLSLSEKESQLKEVQLQVLGKQKALKESELYLSQVELKSKAFQRNIFIGGFLLFILIAFFMYFGFKNQKKLNSQLAMLNEKVSIKNEQLTNVNLQVQKEKKKSDDLLLNILPEEIADELKNKGEIEAKLYNHVSVIFTDFVGFTNISENLSPTELVAEIHRNFTAFDAIIEKYNIEKIKTIGDAYLAVCGLPNESPDHAEKIVRAAIDIRDYVSKNGGRFQIRIGVNSGPVVAGIVGVKKYAYDIWGDTVNTAARMEQKSEPGKINISGATYDLIKGHFNCEHRGKIAAKNKGEIDMYFVN